jgi:hypothetical protein
MGLLLGEPVSYQIVSDGMTGALSTAPLPGGLPFGFSSADDDDDAEISTDEGDAMATKPQPGNLVVAIDGDDEAIGLVRTVAGERVTVSLDVGGENLRTFSEGQIAVVHRVCGARGGPSKLSKLPSSTPVRIVLDCLLGAAERGEITQREEGLPLTAGVIESIEESVLDEQQLPEEV